MIPNDHLLSLLKDRCYKKGDFTLSSGQKTDHYVNCKNVTLSGEGLYNVASSMLEFIDPDVVAVAGLTLGAAPLVSAVAMHSFQTWRPLDALIVRKFPKGHGAELQIEGPLPPAGSKVVVLEDVVTTATSAIKAVNVLRDQAGLSVDRIVTIVDRQKDGEAEPALRNANVELKSLFTLHDLIYA